MKTEFDNIEEYEKAWSHLEDYHDCEKSHNKIVGITLDNSGNTCCGYCGEKVKYPRLNKKIFEEWIKINE